MIRARRPPKGGDGSASDRHSKASVSAREGEVGHPQRGACSRGGLQAAPVIAGPGSWSLFTLTWSLAGQGVGVGHVVCLTGT